MRRREQRRATTLSGVVATAAVRTAYQHRNPREPVYSAGRSARRASPALPLAHLDRQVHGVNEPSCVSQQLPPSLPVGRRQHRCGDHPQPATAPRGLGPNMARALATQPDPQLGRLGPHVRGKFPGHIRTPWELLGHAHRSPANRSGISYGA
jgi:hypothetical protein